MIRLSSTEWKLLFVMMLLGLCGLLGVDIHTPSLPSIANTLHSTFATAQQSIALFLLGEAVSLLFYGPLSDHYGRKPCVSIGLAIAVLASYAAAYSTSMTFFLTCRVLQGVGSGVCMGLGRTILADVLEGNRFVVVGSYFSLVLSLSPLLAPIVGGYMQHAYGWAANFVLLGSILLLVLLLYMVLCPETHDPKKHDVESWHQVFHNYAVLARDPVFMVSVLLSGLGMGCVMVYATISPIILQVHYHVSAVTYGWALGVVGAFGMLGKIVFPWFVHRWSAACNVLVGLWGTALSGLVLLFVVGLFGQPPLWVTVAVPCAVMFAQTFVLPNTAAYALTPHHTMRGAAGAMYGSVQLWAGFLATAVVSITHFRPIHELATTYLLFGGISVFAFIVLMRSKRFKQAEHV